MIDRKAFNDPDCENSPERRLMLAIIANAISDLMSQGPITNRSERDKARREALAWFRMAGPEYELVCHMAGLDPANTRRAALTYAATEKRLPRHRRTSSRGPSRPIVRREAA